MKLRECFVTHDIGSTQVMVGAGGSGFDGIARSNATAAFIIDMLKDGAEKNTIAEAMVKEYNITKETAETDVEAILEKLRSINALEE